MGLLNRGPRRGAEGDAAQMTLMDHLRELRNRIVKCVIALVVGAVLGWFLYERIFRFMTSPYCASVKGTDRECQLYFTDLLAGFMLHLKVSTYTGLLIALPVILWQLWQFITPGLYRNERRYAFAFVSASLALFTLGAALAYYTLPPMIGWLVDNSGPADLVSQITTADKYFWLAAMLMIGFGLGFEFPIVLVALQIVGIIDNKLLRSYRRHAAVGIVALVAVITPGGDPISLLALSVPMYLFYEVAILIGWVMARRKDDHSTTADTTPQDSDELTVER